MRVIGGAIVILAGSIMVAAGAVAQAVQLTAGEQADIHWPGVEAMMPVGSLVCFLGLILLITGYHGRRWTDEETALLGTMPDAEVAERTGWSAGAVRDKRGSLGITNPTSPAWTEADEDLLRRLPPQEAAAQTDRTLKAVYEHRREMDLPGAKTLLRKGRCEDIKRPSTDADYPARHQRRFEA